jgi:hypothetical protein
MSFVGTARRGAILILVGAACLVAGAGLPWVVAVCPSCYNPLPFERGGLDGPVPFGYASIAAALLGVTSLALASANLRRAAQLLAIVIALAGLIGFGVIAALSLREPPMFFAIGPGATLSVAGVVALAAGHLADRRAMRREVPRVAEA